VPRKWNVADPHFIGYTYKNWEAVHSGTSWVLCQRLLLCGAALWCGVLRCGVVCAALSCVLCGITSFAM